MDIIMILVGDGISAESGLGADLGPDDCGPKYHADEVAAPETFDRDPAMVHRFYNWQRKLCRDAKPNDAHHDLRKLEAKRPAGQTLIVTQNVGNLHERAGSIAVWHMHGEIYRGLCAECDHRWDAPEEMFPGDTCPACGVAATRPDITWSGESPHCMNDIYLRLKQANIFVQIGCSGRDHPAAGFVDIARAIGLAMLVLNLRPPSNAAGFEESRFRNSGENRTRLGERSAGTAMLGRPCTGATQLNPILPGSRAVRKVNIGPCSENRVTAYCIKNASSVKQKFDKCSKNNRNVGIKSEQPRFRHKEV